MLKFQLNMKRQIMCVELSNISVDYLRTKINVTFNLVNSSVSIVSNIGSLTEPYQRKVVLLRIVS